MTEERKKRWGILFTDLFLDPERAEKKRKSLEEKTGLTFQVVETYMDYEVLVDTMKGSILEGAAQLAETMAKNLEEQKLLEDKEDGDSRSL